MAQDFLILSISLWTVNCDIPIMPPTVLAQTCNSSWARGATTIWWWITAHKVLELVQGSWTVMLPVWFLFLRLWHWRNVVLHKLKLQSVYIVNIMVQLYLTAGYFPFTGTLTGAILNFFNNVFNQKDYKC